MTRGGVNKKPTRLHAVQGTSRGDRRRFGQPPIEGDAVCPGWLAPEAKLEWRRVAPELKRLGLLTALDSAAFAAYCVMWGRLVAAVAIIERDGLVVSGHRGVRRKHPLVSAVNQCVSSLRSICAEFGMSPAARGRMDIESPPIDDDDPLAPFLRPDRHRKRGDG